MRKINVVQRVPSKGKGILVASIADVNTLSQDVKWW
jgi:hypothetical protein